jgi:hypothetical protein
MSNWWELQQAGGGDPLPGVRAIAYYRPQRNRPTFIPRPPTIFQLLAHSGLSFPPPHRN